MSKLNESASTGATSAGNIASVSVLNFPLQRRLPPTNLFANEYTRAKNTRSSSKKSVKHK